VKGIDGKHALLKIGRAYLCVKWKNLFAKDNSLTAEEEAYLASGARFNHNFAFAS